MRKTWIKTRRDRWIAGIFMALIAYVLSEPIWNLLVRSLTGVGLNEFMYGLFPDKMTYANYPRSYGSLFVMAVVMTVIWTLLLAVQKKGWKKVLAAAGMGMVISLGVLAAFYVHCRLIVGTAADRSGFHASIYFHSNANLPESAGNGTGKTSFSVQADSGDALAQQLAGLCYEMEPYAGEEQRQIRAQFKEDGDWEQGRWHLWFIFPEKYGHEYWLSVYVTGEYIYIDQTQNGEYTFYKDNGILKLLDELSGEERGL